MASENDSVYLERRLLWLATLTAGGYLLYLLAPILTPFVAAALLAYIGDPLVDRLERVKLPRTPAVLAVFVLTFFVIALLVLLVVPLVKSQADALIDRLPSYAAWVEANVLPRLEGLVDTESQGNDVGIAAFVAKNASVAGSWGARVVGSVSRSGSLLLSGLLSLFLVPVLTFYLLRDWDRLVSTVALLIPRGQRETVADLSRQTDAVLGGFLRGQVMVMSGLAIIYSSGLALLGLDFALAIGVLAGLVSFVPYLGFVIGIGLAGLATLVEGGGWLTLVGVVGVFAGGQAIEGMLLTPRLVGSRIGLHPVAVIFAVLAGAQLFGFFGILLALPVAAVLSVLARYAHQRLFPDEHLDLTGSGES
jgi:predicted PurR-regulated permease PerM